jgi:predicted aldo/keto reductase-like oxidoreductase
MHYRPLGKTGFQASVIGFGAWAIGGSWGDVDDEQSLRALHAAADAGVPGTHRNSLSGTGGAVGRPTLVGR